MKKIIDRMCTRCIMNSGSDANIVFDEGGVCNHCHRYDDLISARVLKGADGKKALKILIDSIKRAGKNKEYDCIIGVSGGVDSTYVAYLVKQYGLRPLAVHFDNGWNSELAVSNIERVLKKLDIDLYTYVVDWPEFRDLQLSFLKASTPDGEIPTDHAINALLWKEACRHGIKYIISGMNFVTESISVPDWAYGHSDWKYIKDVHRKFGKVKLKSYPRFSLAYLFYANVVRGVRNVSILNYVDYNKDKAMKILSDELKWQSYGGKHHESIYTRFFQGYILPKKFNIDKRYGHLSDLINAGQMVRQASLEEIEEPPYSEKLQQQDLDYVIKKFDLSNGEFESMMNLPTRTFREFNNNFGMVQFLKKVVNKLRMMSLYPR